jgi:hypothetical protein
VFLAAIADVAVSAPLVGTAIAGIGTLEAAYEMPCELCILGRRHLSD